MDVCEHVYNDDVTVFLTRGILSDSLFYSWIIQKVIDIKGTAVASLCSTIGTAVNTNSSFDTFLLLILIVLLYSFLYI